MLTSYHRGAVLILFRLGSAVSNGDGTETLTVRVPAQAADGEDTLFMRVMVSATL